MHDTLSDRTGTNADDRWQSSAIRDLLVHARRDDVISLAGGLPADDLVPSARLAEAAASVLSRGASATWQYGPSGGEPELRSLLAADEAEHGRSTGGHDAEVIVTTGSQQALDLVARVTTRPGDTAVIEDPGYIGAVQALRQNGLQLSGVAVDEAGLDVAHLAARLQQGLRPRLCYVNPTHQNPTGASLDPARALELVALAERYDFVVVADDPYVEVGFTTTPSTRSILHPNHSPQVVRLGSTSKTLSPGLRVGWLTARPEIAERVILAKQGADLHTGTLNQQLVIALLRDRAWWAEHITRLQAGYGERCATLRAAVVDLLAGATPNTPRGGFFLWVDAGTGVDTDAALTAALEEGVAFVPGNAFAVGTDRSTFLRLSFSNGDPAMFAEAVERLGRVLPQPAAT